MVTIQVEVEFYGVPRLRTGLDALTLSFDTNEVQLADVLRELRTRFPKLLTEHDESLPPEFIANINRQRWVRDGTSGLDHLDTLMFMSADPGG